MAAAPATRRTAPSSRPCRRVTVSPQAARHDAARTVLVWDLPTRLFHWLTVVLVVTAYVTARLNWMEFHARAGTVLFALLLFRLVWGFVGSETARFAQFLTSPRGAVQHLAHLFRRVPDSQIGHNPAGGWMVLLLLALLLGEVLTGILTNNDVADAGPLTELVSAAVANAISDLHTLLWDALLAAVTLHLVAIAVYTAAKGHHLLRPMLTGRKRLAAPATSPRVASSVLALVVLAGSTVAAVLLASFL
jgi:cytochrome b